MEEHDKKYAKASEEIEEKEREEKERYATKVGRFNQLRDTLAKYLPSDEFMEIPNGTEIVDLWHESWAEEKSEGKQESAEEEKDEGKVLFHKILFKGATPRDVFDRWEPDSENGEEGYHKIGDVEYGEVNDEVAYDMNNGTAAFFDGAHYFVARPDRLYKNDHETLKKITADLEMHGRGLGGNLFVLFSNSDAPRDKNLRDNLYKVLERGKYNKENKKPSGKGDEVFNALMQSGKSKM
jgi:hypothetical protein